MDTALGFVVIFAALFALVAKSIRQPVVPAYILAGVAVGPLCLARITDPNEIQALNGFAMMLVMLFIGTDLDFSRIKSVGMVVTLGGTAQVILTALAGALIALACGMNLITCIYIGLVFSFASTTLVVKTLADKGQLDTLHGGITLGVLIFQDILAVLAMSLLQAKHWSVGSLITMSLVTLGMISLGVLASQYLLPRIFRKICDSAEVMTLMSVAIGYIFARLAESQGLSGSIGALIVGVNLANLPQRLEIQSRVKSLRDFFVPVFFAALGVQIVVPSVKMLPLIALLSVACLTIKPLINMVVVALSGYQERTSFFTGMALVSISEFGLVLVTIGIKMGQIKQEVMTISIIVMAISMLLSTYLFSDKLFVLLKTRLVFLNKIGPDAKLDKCQVVHEDQQPWDAVLIGCHRIGRHAYDALVEDGYRVVVLESSYERARELLDELKMPCCYADATDPDSWKALGDLSQLKMVVSTIPDPEQELLIYDYVRLNYPDAKVVLEAEHAADALAFLEDGVDMVLSPHNMMFGFRINSGGFADLFKLDKIGGFREEVVTHLEKTVSDWHVRRSTRSRRRCGCVVEPHNVRNCAVGSKIGRGEDDSAG